MKKRYLYVGLLMSCALLLSACSGKKETEKANKADSVKVTQSTTEANKAKVTESSKESQTTLASAQASPASTTSSEKVTEASSVKMLKEVALPKEVLGTWSGASQQASEVTFTISADGTFVTKHDFGNGLQEVTAKITKLVQYNENTYFVTGLEGDWSALLPGITGLGGWGGVMVPGFRLDNGQYIPLGASGLTVETANYDTATDFGGVSYSK